MVGLYGAVALAIGIWITRRSSSGANEFLLGGRRVPTAAVLFSLVATELSAATFVGVPSGAYGAVAWTYLQFGIGSILARVVLAIWVIPLYHRRRVRTVYEFIGSRFGEGARRATAITFLIGRWLASSVRLFIAAEAFSLVIGGGVDRAIIGCGVIAALYSVSGGIRAVIWTDAWQGAVLLAGAIALLAAIAEAAPDGLGSIFEWARSHDATRVFSFGAATAGATGDTPSWLATIFASSSHIVTAVLGGFFLTLATHSTDHDMVQRLLTAKSGRSGGRALILSGFVNVPVVVLFLAIGTGFLALDDFAGVTRSAEPSRHVVAHFVKETMAAPWRGVVIAGLFAAAMSSLDSAICAMGATWSVDVCPPMRQSEPETREAWRERRNALGVAVALIVGSLGFASYDRHFADPSLSLVEVALSAMTVVSGALLGVFGAGFLTRRGSSRGAVIGLLSGSVIGAGLFSQKLLLGTVPISWPWWIPISGAITFFVVCSFRGEHQASQVPA